MPKFTVSRVSGKPVKAGAEMRHVITSVFADSYEIETTNDIIPFHRIHFFVSKERIFREPVLGRVSTLAVSGDVAIEQE